MRVIENMYSDKKIEVPNNAPVQRGEMGYHAPIQCLKVDPHAILPTRANPFDAGADLFAAESLEILPGESALVSTGIAMKIPRGLGGFVDPRSSMRTKGLTTHGTGIIDADYRGPVKVFIHNMGDGRFVIQAYITRIGQITIVPVMLPQFIDSWNDTERGTGGFGSTG